MDWSEILIHATCLSCNMNVQIMYVLPLVSKCYLTSPHQRKIGGKLDISFLYSYLSQLCCSEQDTSITQVIQ